MDKAPDAYRTISEVADDLDLPQHVLRFWETRFSQIRPLKRGGGRRYYRPEDIDLLKGIRHLLYGEGYTIRGVQRIIKENGVKAIQALGRGEGASPLQKPRGPEIIDPGREPDAAPARAGTRVPVFAEAAYPAPPFIPADLGEDDEPEMEDDEPLDLPPTTIARPAPAAPPPAPVSAPAAMAAPVDPRPLVARPAVIPPARPAPAPRVEPPFVAVPASAAHAAPPSAVAAPLAEPPIIPAAAPPAPMPSMRPVLRDAAPPPPAARLAADDIRRLQAALYELLECRKRLDEAFDPR
ncbi:MerR family transcriptional regulator [Phreatobacter sp.]|uniref:MerR family transcriptional regulator n=1 Tax=Phreatobacter sp. TaxID=1966341 RepID=UPI0022C946F0|nr:MerR family transcriptional regulator [Phreatobacter sp.]MCZ8314611.1 MerR family transcriptional regulator [Phreatobacter sp.]